MRNNRFIYLCLLFVVGYFIMYYAFKYKIQPPYASSLAPFYQMLGKPVKALDRSLTRIIPVDQMDEKELGIELKKKYSRYFKTDCAKYVYVNNIMNNLQPLAKKPFHYTVYPIKAPYPNACALPGGVIFVTTGLLKNLKSESEFVSVLLHEMAHIERSHCFDHVRAELLSRKISNSKKGATVDFVMTFLLRHTYNKEIEDEADTMAHELLLKTKYDPSAQARAFKHIHQYCVRHGGKESEHAHIIRDYFRSHPPIKQRIKKWYNEANNWWHYNKGQKRYVGKKNILQLKSFFVAEYASEWIK